MVYALALVLGAEKIAWDRPPPWATAGPGNAFAIAAPAPESEAHGGEGGPGRGGGAAGSGGRASRVRAEGARAPRQAQAQGAALISQAGDRSRYDSKPDSERASGEITARALYIPVKVELGNRVLLGGLLATDFL